MNRLVLWGALTSGALSLATISLFPDSTPWEIALSFPMGAVMFLLVWVLGEKWGAA